MSRSKAQLHQDQLGLFDVQTTVTFGSTDAAAEPQFNHQFLPASLPAVIAPPIEIAEPGIAVTVFERARILGNLVLPLLAGIAQREGLQDAVYTATPPDISLRALHRAAANDQDMKLTAWNLLHSALGYEAAASYLGVTASAKRLVSEDVAALESHYGRGRAQARKSFQKLLRQQRP